MNHADYVAAAARELDDIQAVFDAQPVTAAVPTCAGWTLADLAAHVGLFCGFWSHVLCEGAGRPKPQVLDPPEGQAITGWFGDVGRGLLVEMGATPPETPVWTWYDPDRTAGFVARRVANELSVHRYDAESAGGACAPIPHALAADGIDEMITRLVLARTRTGQATGQTLHLHATDGGEWLLVLRPDAIDVTERHAKADLALRGAASDLELLLYQRPPLGPVERFGDASVLDAWYAEFTF